MDHWSTQHPGATSLARTLGRVRPYWHHEDGVDRRDFVANVHLVEIVDCPAIPLPLVAPLVLVAALVPVGPPALVCPADGFHRQLG